VLALFALLAQAPLSWEVIYFPLAIILQGVLLFGIGLIVAPLVVFFRDLERAIKLFLRFLFYASPIIYAYSDLPAAIQPWAAVNPLAGIFDLYRAAFFPEELNWAVVGVSAAMSMLILIVGLWVFTRAERSVLKEI
jgi:ABC-2 type transport system permease protein